MSEEAKRQALVAADVAVSLVDNAQETFGLAVAEAMAAGLPLVVSDWSGYRDLVRDGIDGYLIPSAWAASATKVSASLGWQQFTGMQGFPAVAGALAQLVQLDLAAAEMALLTVLSQPTMARAMGAAAARRACDLFAPEVVMASHEELLWGWSSAAEGTPLKLIPQDQLVPSSTRCECLNALHHTTSQPFQALTLHCRLCLTL